MGLGASAAGRWGCPTHHTGWCAGRRDNRARGPRGRGGADALQCGQGANHRTQHTSMLTRYSHTSLTSWPSTFCRRWFAHCVCQTASGTQQAGDRHHTRRARDGGWTQTENSKKRAKAQAQVMRPSANLEHKGVHPACRPPDGAALPASRASPSPRLECGSRARHGTRENVTVKRSISDREIGLFMDEQSKRDLFLKRAQSQPA